jgi:hypothetical protein
MDQNGWHKGYLLPSILAKVVFTNLELLGKQLLISLFISFVKCKRIRTTRDPSEACKIPI